MNVTEVKLPSRHIGGIYVYFDNGDIYNLREDHTQEYYRARLAYYISGQRGKEPSLKEYALQHGEKMDNQSQELTTQSGLTVQTVVDDITKHTHHPQCDCGCTAPVAPTTPQITMDVYAIRSADGSKWFQKRTDKGWVETPTKAKLYPKAKLGYARAIVTHYAKMSGNTNIPNIVKFSTVATEVSDEKARLDKTKTAEQRRKDRAEREQKKRLLDEARRKFELARAEFEAVQRQLLAKAK